MIDHTHGGMVGCTVMMLRLKLNKYDSYFFTAQRSSGVRFSLTHPHADASPVLRGCERRSNLFARIIFFCFSPSTFFHPENSSLRISSGTDLGQIHQVRATTAGCGQLVFGAHTHTLHITLLPPHTHYLTLLPPHTLSHTSHNLTAISHTCVEC